MSAQLVGDPQSNIKNNVAAYMIYLHHIALMKALNTLKMIIDNMLYWVKALLMFNIWIITRHNAKLYLKNHIIHKHNCLKKLAKYDQMLDISLVYAPRHRITRIFFVSCLHLWKWWHLCPAQSSRTYKFFMRVWNTLI